MHFIYFPSVACPFVFLMVSFDDKKHLFITFDKQFFVLFIHGLCFLYPV